MRGAVESIVDELKRLKESGVTRVYLEDASVTGLKRALHSRFVRAHTGEGSPSGNPDGLAAAAAAVPLQPPQLAIPGGDKSTRLEWLRHRVLHCPVCNANTRPGKKVVFGVGNLNADVFFCGEAPGADEEIQGEPFVGRAGQLLTRIIETMGLARADVYIGNIMNWRPATVSGHGNRPPTAEEMTYCLPYLKAQVEIVSPKIIVALGGTAVNGLLGPDPSRRMGNTRGRWFEFEGTPLLATYHPSYVLRNGSLSTKRLVWEDMLQVMGKLEIPISERQRNYFETA